MREKLLMTCAVVLAAFPGVAAAHCEIPCGIYDDALRFKSLHEDVATIVKSMEQIIALSAQAKPNHNQLVRWVMNKEAHADRIRSVLAQYFLAQRIQPVRPGAPEWDAYTKKLALVHHMIHFAMKCKQTTDLAHPARIKAFLSMFEGVYTTKAAAKHVEKHHGKEEHGHAHGKEEHGHSHGKKPEKKP